jgi:predicted Fe-Mo cluster-binding NifX family protein
MTIAMPSWEGRVSPLLDVAGRLLVVHIEEGLETGRQEILLSQSQPSQLAKCIRETGSEVLVCGGISQELASCLAESGVRVLPHICGEIDLVLHAFLKNMLNQPKFKMPGCCKRRCGWHNGPHRFYGRKI